MLKKCASFFSLFIAIVLGGCATGVTLDLVDKMPAYIGNSPDNHFNFVARNPPGDKSSGKSGGLVTGKQALGEPKWEMFSTTKGALHTLTLLVASNRNLYKSEELERLRADGTELSLLLDMHLRVLQTLTEKALPSLDLTYRMIPVDAHYRFLKDMPINVPKRISMELLAVVPYDEIVEDSWRQSLTKTAIHEYIHTLRWDPTFFPRKVSPSEDEAQAYTLDGCVKALVQNQLPLSMSATKLPITLKEILGDYPDAPVSELISQLVEQRKDHPTVIGFNAALLGMYRLGQAYTAGGYSLTKPDMVPFQAYCRAVAKDEINWLSPDVEKQIKVFAQAK